MAMGKHHIAQSEASTTSKFQNTRPSQLHLRRWNPNLTIEIVNRLQDVELQIKSERVDSQIVAQSLLGICLRAPR